MSANGEEMSLKFSQIIDYAMPQFAIRLEKPSIVSMSPQWVLMKPAKYS